ncbi:alpha-aminoadipic semialdehyde synthase, partial [Tremellales sp. Uapishka_1]
MLRTRLVSISTRRRLSAHQHLSTLGIRREDPARIWERRTPLTPHDLSGLIAKQIPVEVESCQRRCFKDEAFSKVGAKIVPSLSQNVDVVLGIKEPPLESVEALLEHGKKRIWMMFSHTHKGQEYNVPLLSSLLSPSQTLIDHELLVDDSGKRIAGFGWFAGAVGAGEALSLTGLALLKRGESSPLLHLPRPYTFPSLDLFKKALSSVGQDLRAENQVIEPIVIGLTGGGNVARGAKDMLDSLGVTWIEVDQLKDMKLNDTSKIYACALTPAAYLRKQDGTPYNRAEYRQSPDLYKSIFAANIAPYLTTLIHGAGWQSGYPRMMTTSEMDSLVCSQGDRRKWIALQDISCDIGGGLEFVNQHTTIDKPYYEGSGGLLVSTIDILPTELPREASEHFSQRILPFVQEILEKRSEDLGEEIKRGTIIRDGRLERPHQWLGEKVAVWQDGLAASNSHEEAATAKSVRRRKVLLLGSGLVAGPAVEVFLQRRDFQLVIASNNIAEARALAKGRGNVEVISLDVSDQRALDEAVRNADVVVSLLPAPMHPLVAQHCINNRKHLVTASYISPEMRALDQAARENNVILLGECGLDPGIDSMAAMRILERVGNEGKKVSSFVSWCGGLPEPSSSNVPFGYKFSWSPKAVLTAALNDARYKLDDEVIDVKGDRLLASHFPKVELWKGLALEGLANRDSIPYAEKYGMGEVESLKDVFRGTLRYQGFSRLLDSFRMMGMLSSAPQKGDVRTWNEYLLECLRESSDSRGKIAAGEVKNVLWDILGKRQAEETLQTLEWLSLLPSTGSAAYPPFPSHQKSPIDLLATLLASKLAYLPHERDSVLLHHSFKFSHPSDPMLQSVTASLVCNGTDEASAMATTVGKTLAFAACRVADGKIRGRGVRGPYEREVWEGVLDDLESVGVVVTENWN